MRSFSFAALLVIATAILFAGNSRTDAQPPKAEPVLTEKEKEAKLKIVPVVVIKPGEVRELTLSTGCTLGLTRSGGFNLREMDGTAEESPQDAKVWKRAGVQVEAPDTNVGPMQAESPEYKPLLDAGINVFTLKVSATKEAKPGVYNLHLVDATCSGWCSTDFRVLVVAANNKAAAKVSATNAPAADAPAPNTAKTEKLVLKEYPALPYGPGYIEYIQLLRDRLDIEYEVPKLPAGVAEKDFSAEVDRHNATVKAALRQKHGVKIFEELREEASKRWQEKTVKPAKP